MKQALCWLLCLCLAAVCFTACTGGPAAPTQTAPSAPSASGPDPSAASQPASQPAPASEPASEPAVDVAPDPALTAQGAPAVEPDLQALFLEAYAVYGAFAKCGFTVDPSVTYDIGGMPCHPIVHPSFSTYTQCKAYLAGLFTDRLIQQELLTPGGCVRAGEDDRACMIDAGGGSDVTYAGHVFAVDSRTETEMQWTATALYAADAYTGDPIYTMPADMSGFTTRTFTYKLVKTEAGWRFSQFAYME